MSRLSEIQRTGQFTTWGLMADSLLVLSEKCDGKGIPIHQVDVDEKRHFLRLASECLLPCIRASVDIEKLTPSQDIIDFGDMLPMMRVIHDRHNTSELFYVYYWGLVGICLAIGIGESVDECAVERLEQFLISLSDITKVNIYR